MTDSTAAPPTLADPIRSSLAGAHARFAQARGAITRYQPDVSVFYGHPTDLSADDYADVAALTPAGSPAVLRDRRSPLPDEWRIVDAFQLVQLSGEGFETSPAGDGVETSPAGDGIVRLTPADVPEMTALVRRTDPGPFLPRTIELGTYLGVRDADGALVAMAGERMHPTGWTEISAVCTAPEMRGRGLATRLMRAVGAGIRARGERPFLHTGSTNPALRLYLSLGFTITSEVPLEIVRIDQET